MDTTAGLVIRINHALYASTLVKLDAVNIISSSVKKDNYIITNKTRKDAKL